MDQEKIGKFILSLRKKHNLTQAEFASRFNVTSQAVSKWENGRGIPDIEILKKISEEFKINIDDILNGEEKKEKKKKTAIITIFVLVILIISLIIFLFLQNKNNENFHFTSLSSNNENFKVEGIAAYSTDKKSIYISKIAFNDNENIQKYKAVECSLFETFNDTIKKISQCCDNKNTLEFNELKTLDELLKQIEFKIDNYQSICKDLTSSSLYIQIDATDSNNNIVSFKIPIDLVDSCGIHK